jgi:hypothetical protein
MSLKLGGQWPQIVWTGSRNINHNFYLLPLSYLIIIFPQGYTKQARNRIPGPTTRYLRYPFIVSSKNGRSLYYPRPSSQNTLGTLSEFISDTKSVDTYPNIHMLWHIFGILALLRIGYMNCHCQKGQASNRVRSLSDLEDPRILFVRAFAGLD